MSQMSIIFTYAVGGREPFNNRFILYKNKILDLHYLFIIIKWGEMAI